jgi:hypothetical protein
MRLMVYIEFSLWICDAIEKCIICGTLGHAGYVSCHKCCQRGTKEPSQFQILDGRDPETAEIEAINADHPDAPLPDVSNAMYFPRHDGVPRTDGAWSTYYQITKRGQVNYNYQLTSILLDSLGNNI